VRIAFHPIRSIQSHPGAVLVRLRGGGEKYGLLTLHLAGGNNVLIYPKPDHVSATLTKL